MHGKQVLVAEKLSLTRTFCKCLVRTPGSTKFTMSHNPGKIWGGYLYECYHELNTAKELF